MLVKNVLKGMINKPFRIIGIISMVLLAGFLYVSLGYTLLIADESLKDYVNEYHQEDFSFEMNVVLSQEEINNHQLDVDYLYQLSDEKKQEIINSRIQFLENTYEINIEKREFKQINYESSVLNQSITMRIFKNAEEINLTYIDKGRLPENEHEIAISSSFAKSNDLSLSDEIDVENKTYKIVGFIYLVDYIYPQLSNESFVFDTGKQTLSVLSDDAFEDFKAPKVTYYAGEFTKGSYTKEDVQEIDHFYIVNVVDAKTAFRTGAIEGEIKGDKAMVNALTGVMLVLAVVIIGIVVNKSIHMEKSQIGVIKALGYSRIQILKAYMLYPIIASIVGSLLGYLFGYICANPFINGFTSYFQMPMNALHFDIKIFLNAIILPIILLNVFSFIVIYFIVKKAPLDLMRVKVKQNVNIFAKKFYIFLKRFSFKTRFKYSIAARGIGKLLITFVGVLIASIYLVFALSFSQSFDRIIGTVSTSADYKYQIIYDQPTDEIKRETDDHFMIMPSKALKDDKEIEITLMGIERTLNRYELENDAGKNLVPTLYEESNQVVISSMLSMIEDININDTMKIIIINQAGNEEIHQVKVVGIMENYTTPYVFIPKETLNNFYHLGPDWHNGIWTNVKETENVKSLFDKEDMIQSIEHLLGMFNIFVYVLVGIAVLLAIIVLVIIAIFNIEDNFKTIAFLKVMGYHNKEITTMVLNIYLPIISIGYLISIPLTLMSLRNIMTTISEELNFAIPFHLSILQTLFGLIIIIVTYYVSLWIAKRRLNKIALQEALKINE